MKICHIVRVAWRAVELFAPRRAGLSGQHESLFKHCATALFRRLCLFLFPAASARRGRRAPRRGSAALHESAREMDRAAPAEPERAPLGCARVSATQALYRPQAGRPGEPPPGSSPVRQRLRRAKPSIRIRRRVCALFSRSPPPPQAASGPPARMGENSIDAGRPPVRLTDN